MQQHHFLKTICLSFLSFTALLTLNNAFAATPSATRLPTALQNYQPVVQFATTTKDKERLPTAYWQRMQVTFNWINMQGQYCQAYPMPKASNARCTASAYDPKKPTMIFIHGWEPGAVRNNAGFNFHVQYYNTKTDSWLGNETKVNLAKAWKKAGWNVGIFHWEQFSDTTYPYYSVNEAAEQAAAKVWSNKANLWTISGTSDQAHNYAKLYNADDNVYSRVYYAYPCTNKDTQSFCRPMKSILFDVYKQVMAGYQGDRVRIVGHSIGTQLAIALTYQVGKAVFDNTLPPQLLPRRLVLLDPFFAPSGNVYLDAVNIDNRKLATQYLYAIADHFGVAVSEYLSSDISVDQWSLISEEAALVTYRPWFDPFYREDKKHSASWLLYLLGRSNQGMPPLYDQDGKRLGNIALSANAPIFGYDASSGQYYGVGVWMGRGVYQDQTEGQYTADPSNDAFQLGQQYGGGQPADTFEVTLNGQTVHDGAVIDVPVGKTIALRTQARTDKGTPSDRSVFWTVGPAPGPQHPGTLKTQDPKGTLTVYPGGLIHAQMASSKPILVTAILPPDALRAVPKTMQFWIRVV